MKLVSILSVLFSVSTAFGWGKQGHSIVNETAAMVLADTGKAEFLEEHAFDLGYYANVPDIVWKKKETYQIEAPQHFMDMEIFERGIPGGAAGLNQAFLLDREEFDAKYPKIPVKAGRSFWRIRELTFELRKTSETLKDPKLSKDEKHELQAKWLVLAGVIGHYVGDLSQPLHVTENYDGEMTGQKGVHSFFEDKLVNVLNPKLSVSVFEKTKKQWAAYHKKSKDASTLTLITQLAENSQKKLKKLLELDKKHPRKDTKKASKAYEDFIAERLSDGALCLAEIWSHNIDWPYTGAGFYNFEGQPAYIQPGTHGGTQVQEIKTEEK